MINEAIIWRIDVIDDLGDALDVLFEHNHDESSGIRRARQELEREVNKLNLMLNSQFINNGTENLTELELEYFEGEDLSECTNCMTIQDDETLNDGECQEGC